MDNQSDTNSLKTSKSRKNNKPSFLSVLIDSTKTMMLVLAVFSALAVAAFLFRQVYFMTGFQSGEFTNWFMGFSAPVRMGMFVLATSVLATFMTAIFSWIGASEVYDK